MYSEDEQGFKKIISTEVIGSYLLDFILEENEKKCHLQLSNGVFELYTPFEVTDSDGNDINIESLIGYVVEFANDIWDSKDNDKSRFELVFDSGSKICAFYLQWSEQNSEYDTDNSSNEADYTITYTSKDGNQFSSGMVYI